MKKLKKASIGVLRLAIGLTLIVYLFHKMDLSTFASVITESLNQWQWLVTAILMFFLCMCIGIVRWKIILDAQELRMSLTRVSSVYFIGQFFNSFMFGSTGGDVVRAYYTTKETHHKKTEAVATIIIDRVIGMVALFLIACVMLIMKAKFYLNHPKTHIPVLLMMIMIITATLGLSIICNLDRFKGWPIFRRINNHHWLGPVIQRMVMAFNLYRRKTSVLIVTLLLSVCNQIFIVLLCYCLGKSLQIHLGIIEYLSVIPLIMSIAAIPITPGGLGVREGLSVTLLGTMGVSNTQALPLSLMVYAIAIAWSLVGGIIFLGYSASSGHTIHDEMVELRQETSSDNG